MSKRLLRVIVTGLPGCGKSALIDALQGMGVPCFSADAEVGKQYEPGADGYRLIKARFDDLFIPSPNAPINKRLLATAMMKDTGLRKEIEGIMHPLVGQSLESFWARQDKKKISLAVAEIPLYLESGWEGSPKTSGMWIPGPSANNLSEDPKALLEVVGSRTNVSPVLVGVHCPASIRHERLEQTRGWSIETIAAMDSWQWPEDKKMAACDIVVDNTGTLQDLLIQTERLRALLEGIADKQNESIVDSFAKCWTNKD